MSDRVFGILVVAFAFLATVAFLSTCQSLGRWLEERAERRRLARHDQMERRSDAGDFESAGTGRSTQTRRDEADEEA
jgi:hypothetical protein